MFSIFKQRKELRDELELTKMRLAWEMEASDKYLGMVTAYKSAIHNLHMNGVINEEQFKAFFAEVDKHQNAQQTT